MKATTRKDLDKIGVLITQHGKDLQHYSQKNPQTARHRFWHLLRSDLMRRRPEEVYTYLTDNELKFAETGAFGGDLAEKFFSPEKEPKELRDCQEALIYACLEMDAAWKLKKWNGPSELQEILNILKQKLAIWSAL